MTLEIVKKPVEPLTPSTDEEVIMLATGAHIFIGVTKAQDHIARRNGFWLREAYQISFTTTMMPATVQGGQPKMANNISVLPPPAAALDPDVTTVQMWVGPVSWFYTPTKVAIDAVRGALIKNKVADA